MPYSSNTVAAVVTASVLGFVAFFAPAVVADLRAGGSISPATFAQAVEGCGIAQLALLGLVGVAVGTLFRVRFWLVGVFTVAALPLWSLIDIGIASAEGVERHNLLPFEWALYACYSLPAVLGSWFAQRTLRGWEPEREQPGG